MEDSDCIVVMGSNMAENHPVAFRWPMKAKVNHGAKLIHVDPRFTRTSAMADIYAPVRAGSDIAFLGGLINFVLSSPRWNNDPFFRTWVTAYTNAATIIDEGFRGAEEQGGVFSGLVKYTGGVPEWPFNALTAEYEEDTWQYAGTRAAARGRTAATQQTGETQDGAGSAQEKESRPPQGPPFENIVRDLLQPEPQTDLTLEHPRCVLQIVRRHFSRYTPEMVERTTGCPRATFLQVAETILANSGAERTTSFAYAVAWTQHTNGVQMIGACALLQLLLGNVGRPGAGVMALRGHVSIQGSTDVPTLYHSIHGYMAHPSALENHATLADYIAAESLPTGQWAETPKYVVSYLKSMYGAAATAENQFGYDWHPKVLGDHSHMAMFAAMNQGRVRGMLCIGQNPATSMNARLTRAALGRLEWLVVKDNWVQETATFWKNAPEVQNGSVAPADIRTEVFFFPSTQVAELEGTFTNTQRLLQFFHKAADAPGDCRSDTWFIYELGKRLKHLHAGSTRPRDQGIRNLVWDYEHEEERERRRGEPSARKILREINGYYSDEPNRHVGGFDELRDDGSTACASWIYSGVYPAPERNLAALREPDPPGQRGSHRSWGWAWPANRRILYNRASADPAGRPWSGRKAWVWWDGKRWTGYDTPDFPATKAPDTKGDRRALGLDALPGTAPFILLPDGKGWLFVPDGLDDGPLPAHYEPAESPVRNPLYTQQASPVMKYWKDPGNPLAAAGDPRYPYVITTYRLTEHYLAGAMSRWLPWLAELQPELFVELSPELAAEKGIANLDWALISTPRGAVRAKALVTRRLRPFMIDGRVVHQVGMPWHWGYEGLSRGDVVNELSALVADPNVSMHEGKAFVCNVERA
jgi:formate dehydrogenase major subunit